MAAWLNLISIIVFCCDRTSGFTRLTWLVITQCIEWQQIKFHGGHFSGLDFALSTSNMPILIMILKRFLNRHKVNCYESVFKICISIVLIQKFDWMCEKSSIYFETIIWPRDHFLKIAYFLHFVWTILRIHYVFGFWQNICQRKWCEYQLIFDWQFQHVCMIAAWNFRTFLVFPRIFLVSNVPKTILKPNTIFRLLFKKSDCQIISFVIIQ